MKEQNERQYVIIEEFKKNLEKLTYAQQTILERILEKNNALVLQNAASLNQIVNYYTDCHSDYSDAY